MYVCVCMHMYAHTYKTFNFTRFTWDTWTAIPLKAITIVVTLPNPHPRQETGDFPSVCINLEAHPLQGIWECHNGMNQSRYSSGGCARVGL